MEAIFIKEKMTTRVTDGLKGWIECLKGAVRRGGASARHCLRRHLNIGLPSNSAAADEQQPRRSSVLGREAED